MPGSTSDGYHTFDELYEHRHWLFLCLMKSAPERAWASRLHSDGTCLDGWFIAGMELSDGKQISYHLPDRLWEAVECLGVETTDPPPWDGHSGADVVARLQEEFWGPPPNELPVWTKSGGEAAHDLLDALEGLIGHVRIFTMSDAGVDAVTAARALIAKARGARGEAG